MSLCGREGAPYRETEEIVCGAGVKECTVQRGRVECVRCEMRKSYRTDGMFMICTVRNAKKLPYGRQVYELYGTKSEKVTVQAVCL